MPSDSRYKTLYLCLIIGEGHLLTKEVKSDRCHALLAGLISLTEVCTLQNMFTLPEAFPDVYTQKQSRTCSFIPILLQLLSVSRLDMQLSRL